MLCFVFNNTGKKDLFLWAYLMICWTRVLNNQKQAITRYTALFYGKNNGTMHQVFNCRINACIMTLKQWIKMIGLTNGLTNGLTILTFKWGSKLGFSTQKWGDKCRFWYDTPPLSTPKFTNRNVLNKHISISNWVCYSDIYSQKRPKSASLPFSFSFWKPAYLICTGLISMYPH